MPAKNHYISFKALGYAKRLEDEQQYANRELLTRITMRCHLKKIKRGDTISVLKKNNKYRNDWTYIWDGEKAVELETEYDEYGHVPKQFLVGDEFQPDHWESVIEHNRIFHPNDNLINQLKFIKSTNPRYLYVDFTIGRRLWRCYAKDKPEFDIHKAYFDNYYEWERIGNEFFELDDDINLCFAYMPIVQ
jgi:hypothetical protein